MNLRKYYLDAINESLHSKDSEAQVGSIVVDHRGVKRVSGWNGFPRGVHDAPYRYRDNKIKLSLICHAEANAIANAAAVGIPLEGCGLVVTKFPCQECAKLIINSGIVKVCTPPIKQNSKWSESNNVAMMMFNEAKVEVEIID